MNNCRVNRSNREETMQSQQASQLSPTENYVIRKLQADITKIKGRLDQKTLEIDELNEMLKAANVTINRLNDRLTYLEEHMEDRRTVSTNDETEATTQDVSTLILGGKNLKNIRSSDLGENTYIRAINGANIDLLKKLGI